MTTQLEDLMLRRMMAGTKNTQAANVLRDMDPRDMGQLYRIEGELQLFKGTKYVTGGNGDLWMFPDGSGLFVVPPRADAASGAPHLITYAGDNIREEAARYTLA